MKNRLFTTVLAATMALAVNATAFAAENIGNYSEDYSKYTSDRSASVVKDSELIWGNWGSGNGFDWNKDGNKHLGIGNVGSSENKILAAPVITECRYIHQKLNIPDFLSVGWDEVEGAVSYEMEMSDSDYHVIKIYETTCKAIAIKPNSGDDAVTGCVKGRKIRVRAIDQDGHPGLWSPYDTIACNVLFD